MLLKRILALVLAPSLVLDPAAVSARESARPPLQFPFTSQALAPESEGAQRYSLTSKRRTFVASMLAAIVPLKKSRAPMTPPALTNREWVWKAIQRLSQTSKDPATTWSFGEVHREIQGAVVPGQTKRLLFYLSEQGDSGVRRFRVRGKKNDGRTHWFNRYRYDQPVLSWNGVQRKDLSAWLPFREQKNMAMAEFLTSDLGGEISELSRQLALAPANDDRERILRLAVQEMLLAYDILRIPRREWTYQKLLKTLTTKRGKLLLNTSDSLARGLEWLERQGFPVLLSRSGGLVSGAVVLDIRTPDLTSVKDGDESQAAIAQRIDLALAARGLQWQVIDEMGTAAGQNWDFTAQMIKLRAGKIDHEETIDRLLLELSRILGRPPASRARSTRTSCPENCRP